MQIIEVIAACILFLLPVEDVVSAPNQAPRIASAHVKSVMKYHGINFIDWNWKRKEYGFWRNGQWCSLSGKRRR